MATKKTKDETMTLMVENSKIIIGKKGVDIFMPHKKVSYPRDKAPIEYANFAMLFGEDAQDSEENKLQYGKVLIGLEMMPSYAHIDPDLAMKLMGVIVDDFVKKLENIPVRDDSDEELLRDAQAILELQMTDMLTEKPSNNEQKEEVV